MDRWLALALRCSSWGSVNRVHRLGCIESYANMLYPPHPSTTAAHAATQTVGWESPCARLGTRRPENDVHPLHNEAFPTMRGVHCCNVSLWGLDSNPHGRTEKIS
jgi:hypothetical protein